MKYGLLVGKGIAFKNTSDGYKNIGDYIQNIAAMQYLPTIDDYIDRESLYEGKEKIKVIMNGWYIGDTSKFPYYNCIIPLPISMHIVPEIAEELLSNKEVFNWFKKYEPIGCRDKETERLLENRGIKAYFSNCLTLTLGKTYKHKSDSEGIIFVDPYLNKHKDFSKKQLFKIFSNVLFHPVLFLKLKKKFIGKTNVYCTWEMSRKEFLFNVLQFIEIYKRIIPINKIKNATFLTHIVKVGNGSSYTTEESKLEYAKSLLSIYENASCVISSRMHCLLPCIAMKTPVLFCTGKYLNFAATKEDAGRWGGINEMLKTIYIDVFKINVIDPIITDLTKFVEKLDKTCTNFINNKVE